MPFRHLAVSVPTCFAAGMAEACFLALHARSEVGQDGAARWFLIGSGVPGCRNCDEALEVHVDSILNVNFDSERNCAAGHKQVFGRAGRTAGQDWVLSLGFGGRVSAVA